MPDIKLPNGKVIKNVPEGVTKEQVMEKAISSGLANQSDFDVFLKSTEDLAPKPSIYSEMAKDIGVPKAFAISTGKGITDIGRGVGALDDMQDQEKQAFKSLQKEYPVTSFVGEVVGQSLPFLLPQTAIGAVGSVPARAVGSTLLGGLEGGAIASAENQDILEGAGIGGTIAGAVEVFAPVIGRGIRKIYSNLTGRPPQGALLDSGGNPTPELSRALDSSGLSWDELKLSVRDMIARQEIGASPEEVARLAGFEQIGAPATKGQIGKDFAQRKTEQGLIESGTEPAAEPLRSEMLRQSEAFKGELKNIADDLGVPQEVGDSLKSALTSRRKILKQEKNDLYRELGETAQQLERVPVFSDGIFDALPDAGTIRRVGILSPNQSEAIKDLLIEYGIDQSVDAVEQASKKGIKPNMLGLHNFEDFRVALNAIERSDVSGAIGNITGPIKKALDEEIELATKALESTGGDVAELAKSARKANATYKTEFDQAKITSKLIDSVKRGSTQPKIEASKAYEKIMSPNTPIEDLERVILSLNKEGALGKKAIADMQSKAVLDLIDSAFSAQSRQISGTRVFGATPYSKQYEKLKPKLDILFKNNKKDLARLENVYQRAQDIIPPSGATPKGSAGFFIDALNKVGVYSIMSKVPAAGPLLEMFRGLGERANSRKVVEKALNSKPKVKRLAYSMDRDYPQIAAALGISGISTSNSEE